MVTGTVLTGAMGGTGFMHCGMVAIEYSSNLAITLTTIAQDANNGSYGPLAITLPSTSGKATKYFTYPTANKWKWLSWQFQYTDPTAQVYLDGCIAYVRPWGSEQDYEKMPMFGNEGGAG